MNLGVLPTYAGEKQKSASAGKNSFLHAKYT